jgi:CheY-like chemotaxis protein
MRVLIADDDEVVRLELEALLRRRGHDVVVTADGT